MKTRLDNSMLEPMFQNIGDCKCCKGEGVQVNKAGLKVKCPCCHGTGEWREREE